jgi:hypothetical protein
MAAKLHQPGRAGQSPDLSQNFETQTLNSGRPAFALKKHDQVFDIEP